MSCPNTFGKPSILSGKTTRSKNQFILIKWKHCTVLYCTQVLLKLQQFVQLIYQNCHLRGEQKLYWLERNVCKLLTFISHIYLRSSVIKMLHASPSRKKQRVMILVLMNEINWNELTVGGRSSCLINKINFRIPCILDHLNSI